MTSNTQIQWKVVKHDEKSNKLEMEQAEIPTPGQYEVLVKIHAVSLNFRDLMIVRVRTLQVTFPSLASSFANVHPG